MDYCNSLAIEQIMTPAYNPRSNGQLERFVNSLKRALRKNHGIETEEKGLHKYLAVYRITPNSNINLVGWFVWFYGISTLAGHSTPNPFLCK